MTRGGRCRMVRRRRWQHHSPCGLLLLSSDDRLCRSWKSKWQAQRKQKHVTQENHTTAHQSKKEYRGYEFDKLQQLQEYIFKLTNEENGKIFDRGMNKDRDVNVSMAVYVRTISGAKCDRRRNTARIMDAVERKTLIPRETSYTSRTKEKF